MSNKHIPGINSIEIEQLKFTADEIKEAMGMENERFGVEVSYSPSEIKIYPKDPNSIEIPIVLTVERPKFVNNLELRLWHMEFKVDELLENEDPRKYHCRWANIPFKAFLEKIFHMLEQPLYLWPVGTSMERK